MKETAFLYFHISLFACSHNTRSPASDYIRCIRTRVFKMQTPDMLKIPEGGLIHFLLYWLHYKKILTTTHINSSIKIKRSQNTTILEAGFTGFYQQCSGCVYYCRIASTAEVSGRSLVPSQYFYSRIYLSTNSTASTYISGVICFSFAFPVTRLITT